MPVLSKNLICFVLLIISTGLMGQTIEIRIKNIRNTEGNISLGIFANQTEFSTEKPFYESKYDLKDVTGNVLVLKIPFQSGRFGVSVLHDQNKNGKMDYNIFGIPREGFGFSDFYHRGIRKPHFDDFDFFIEKNEVKLVIVKMKYF